MPIIPYFYPEAKRWVPSIQRWKRVEHVVVVPVVGWLESRVEFVSVFVISGSGGRASAKRE